VTNILLSKFPEDEPVVLNKTMGGLVKDINETLSLRLYDMVTKLRVEIPEQMVVEE
jgi:hypothetical protein